MKKLLLLLLIIPSIGNSQVKSFDDLKQINSVQQFKRVAIENGYEINPKYKDDNDFMNYGVRLNKNDDGNYVASYWMGYILNDYKYPYKAKKSEWYFLFLDLSYNRKNGICYYDIIVDEIKNQCKFYKVDEDEYGTEIVLYSCVGTSYQGKIGYYTDKGSGYIKHLIGR